MQDWFQEHLLFEHDDFFVFQKPAGIGFHCDEHSVGFFEQIRQAYQHHHSLSPDNAIPLFPVHRLDKMTSGLLLVAKHKLAAARFGTLFEQHAIEKYYLAIAKGKPKKKQGTVKGDMQRGRRSGWMLLPSASNPAITCFKSLSMPNVGSGLRLYLLQPRTGKTHQIRVMMKSLGVGIFGDPIYADKLTLNAADRGYLHAYALKFEYEGQHFEFVSAPKIGALFTHSSCIEALSAWLTPWSLSWPA